MAHIALDAAGIEREDVAWEGPIALVTEYPVCDRIGFLQSQREALKEENERLLIELDKESHVADDYACEADNFRHSAVALCKASAAKWANEAEEAQARGIQVVADGKASRALAAKELAAALEKL